MRLGVDMIALSFVRSADDIIDVHEIMDEFGTRLPVIAKIEKPQAVDNLEGIVDAFDGIMVARGDLGVEMPLEDVPLVQKRAIELARREAKPVIVATQVLESMIENPRPTRAEASDAANAVLDGADALMLSGETLGRGVADRVRAHDGADHLQHGGERLRQDRAHGDPPPDDGWRDHQGGRRDRWDRRSEVPHHLHRDGRFGHDGWPDSAPDCRCWPSRSDPRVRSRLALVWGVETYLVPRMQHTDQFAMQVDLNLIPQGRVARGERVVIVAGSPPGIPGSTNALRVHRIGDAVDGTAPAYRPEEVTG